MDVLLEMIEKGAEGGEKDAVLKVSSVTASTLEKHKGSVLF